MPRSSCCEVSVVIVCMNRLGNLYPCLRSIQENTSVSHEILVVAYLFSPENLAKAKADFPDVIFIESSRIRGFSENNNLALSQARGRYCFVLNDDTEFSQSVIDNLVEDMEKLPSNAAIVSPKLLNEDGTLQLCGRPEYPSIYYLLQQWHLHYEPIDNVRGHQPIFNQVYQTCNIAGSAFLIKTSVFRELGWFDETYFFTPEDIALSYLARKRGYGVYVDAAVCLVHKWKKTVSGIAPAVRPAAVKGSLIFFAHGSRVRYFLLASGVWLAETAKYLKASAVNLIHPSEENLLHKTTFKNIKDAIFTSETPEQIFKKHYRRG